MKTPRISLLLATTVTTCVLLAGCAAGAPEQIAETPASAPAGDASDGDNDTGDVESFASAQFDGVLWTSAYESASYFAGGTTLIDPSGSPYFQLALPSADESNPRQLTIALFNFPGGTGEWQDRAEVLLTGGDATQGYQYDVPDQKTDFVFEITSWDPQADGSVVFSATFGGNLVGVIGSPGVLVENGTVTNLSVDVFTEAF